MANKLKLKLNLGVIQSGPAALFGFRTLIFPDTNSAGIERKKLLVLVCHHYSLAFVYNLGSYGQEENVH